MSYGFNNTSSIINNKRNIYSSNNNILLNKLFNNNYFTQLKLNLIHNIGAKMILNQELEYIAENYSLIDESGEILIDDAGEILI